MVTYFNKRDLVKFGNYLLSEERKKLYESHTREMIRIGTDPLPTEERLKMVNHADIANWIHKVKLK